MSLSTLRTDLAKLDKLATAIITHTPATGGHIETLLVIYPSSLDSTDGESKIVKAAEEYVKDVSRAASVPTGSQLLDGKLKKVSYRYFIEDFKAAKQTGSWCSKWIVVTVWFTTTLIILFVLYRYNIQHIERMRAELNEIKAGLNK